MSISAELTPYASFLRQATSFHASSIYLLNVEFAVRDDENSALSGAHRNLTEKILPIHRAPYDYFMARMFISHVASFEVFLQETVSLVLKKHPKKIGAVEFRLADILDASSNDELILRATEQTLNKLMYAKPREYLADICNILSITSDDLSDDWSIFVEVKARRDLGVHNAWIVNATYLRKLAEAGITPSLLAGSSAVPSDALYRDAMHEALDRLALQITRKVVAKHWPQQLPDLDE